MAAADVGLHFNPDLEEDDREDEQPEEERDERDERVIRTRIHPLEEFGPRKFRRRFRITPAVARHLIADFYGFVPIFGEPIGESAVTISDHFCLGLRYLATGANYSLVADYQGVSLSTVSRAVRDISDYFYENSYKYVKWPANFDEQLDVAQQFMENHERPRVLGCIDGTHIAIRRPHIHPATFLNRKGYYSLNATVICDANLKITHINPKWGGSVGDGYTWNNSTMRRRADAHEFDPFYLLGDSGYGCWPNLFPPVLVPLREEDLQFNRWHRRTRVIVENTIGLLKQRWRCLDSSGGYLFHKPARAARIVVACACLHNVAMEYGIPNDLADNDPDHFQAQHIPLAQPNDEEMLDDETAERTAYITAHF